MSNETNETIADIVADIRAQNQGLPEDSYALSPLVCDLLSLADRIEAANKLDIAAKDAEIARLRALVKGLLDASSISCADCKYDCYNDHSNCIIHDASNYIEEIEVK